MNDKQNDIIDYIETTLKACKFDNIKTSQFEIIEYLIEKIEAV